MLLHKIINAYILILLVRSVMSWFPPSSVTNPSVRQIFVVIYKLTEPVLAPVRRLIMPVRVGAGAVDFSTFIVIALLTFLNARIH